MFGGVCKFCDFFQEILKFFQLIGNFFSWIIKFCFQIVTDPTNSPHILCKLIKILESLVFAFISSLLSLRSSFIFIALSDVVGTNSALIKILQPIENFICTKIKGNFKSHDCDVKINLNFSSQFNIHRAKTSASSSARKWFRSGKISKAQWEFLTNSTIWFRDVVTFSERVAAI